MKVGLDITKMFYFVDDVKPQIIALTETGECKRFEYRGKESDFDSVGWHSCQVGQSRLFQVDGFNFSIL